jgi:hydroxyacylglutathione hydrolase
VYLSSGGGDDWSYRWPREGDTIEVAWLSHGETFMVGNIEFRALLTPGHTPEHVCFLVTDRGGDADEPMGLLSGDFLFVGDVGRPDLLETAAGVAGAREPSARALYESLGLLDGIDGYVQVWPGHGAGSACGKALGAIPTSTIGYERRFNPALRARGDGERAFLEYVLSGQPEPPVYFARMKRENRDGPAILGELPKPALVDASALGSLDLSSEQIVDLRPWEEFRAGHLSGSVWCQLDPVMSTAVGSFFDPMREVMLVCEAWQVEPVVRNLIRIGYDKIVRHARPEDVASLDGLTTIRDVRPDEVDGSMVVLDVRRATEHEECRIEGSINVSHTHILRRLDELPRDRTLLLQCQTGIRSGATSGVLASRGYDVRNLAGGMVGWLASGRETVGATSLV